MYMIINYIMNTNSFFHVSRFTSFYGCIYSLVQTATVIQTTHAQLLINIVTEELSCTVCLKYSAYLWHICVKLYTTLVKTLTTLHYTVTMQINNKHKVYELT